MYVIGIVVILVILLCFAMYGILSILCDLSCKHNILSFKHKYMSEEDIKEKEDE